MPGNVPDLPNHGTGNGSMVSKRHRRPVRPQPTPHDDATQIRSEKIDVRVTPDEKAAFEAAARAADRPVSDWLRHIGRKETGLTGG